MHTIELMVHNQKHIINSQVLHNLKYKVFAFDRNFHLLVPNSLQHVQSILASLDYRNQASLFCYSFCSQIKPQTQPVDILKKRN